MRLAPVINRRNRAVVIPLLGGSVGSRLMKLEYRPLHYT